MNYDLEREIWSRVFKSVLKVSPQSPTRHSKLKAVKCCRVRLGDQVPLCTLLPHSLQVNAKECSLCMTEPLLNFKSVQAATEQVRSKSIG